MKWSQIFIPTLRDDPADAEAVSHKLLVRGGFVRQLMSGVYTLLPLGFRVCHKIQTIAREEMNNIGAQEFLLPAIHPSEIWKQSGRWDLVGREMFRLVDRKGADLALGAVRIARALSITVDVLAVVEVEATPEETPVAPAQ